MTSHASPYSWIFFDADDTLFDFRRAEECALREIFEGAGLADDPALLAAYATVNRRAWRDVEAGRLTPARLRVRRFEDLLEVVGLAADPEELAAAYLRRLAEQTHLVDGALEIVERLRPTHGIAIVTNGLADVQRPRLAASPLARHIDHLVISEEVGVAKPDPAIFEIVLERTGKPALRDVLVVGDSLASDIAGGVAAGLDTCWYNPGSAVRPDESAVPTYEIRRLADLPGLLSAAAVTPAAGGLGSRDG